MNNAKMPEARQSAQLNNKGDMADGKQIAGFIVIQPPVDPAAEELQQSQQQQQWPAEFTGNDTRCTSQATLNEQISDLQISGVQKPLTPGSEPLSQENTAEDKVESHNTFTAAPETAEAKPSLNDSNRNLCKVFALTPIPTIILDSDLRIIDISNSHLELFKLGLHECLGRRIFDMEPSKIPVPDVAILDSVINTAISTQNVQVMHDVEDYLSQSVFRMRATPIFEANRLLYVVLEALNITDPYLKSKIHENAYASETYRVLVDTVSDYAIFMLDTKGYITTWNAGAAILKGYTAEEVLGKHFSMFYGEDDCAQGKPRKELVLSLHDGKVEDEGWRYRKDGSRFWANVTITPVHQFGHHVGFVKVVRDLTERKAAETRLIAAYEETSKLKSDFLANMSHEIRTPMNGVLGALSLLNSTALSQNQREYATIIEESTSRRKHRELCDPNCPPRNPEIEVKSIIDPGFPSHVKGDPLRFRQILQNLVGNAVKFTDKGYIHVRTCFKEDERDDYSVTVEVIDSGIGVADEAMNTLFAPFTRSANSATKRYQGTGLGLSICKSLAELMGGAVGYRTNPDCQGSIFWLKIKLGRIDAASPRSRVLESSDPCEDIRKIAPRKQLLLVEDNMVNQVVMLKILKSLNFERVDAAWDGAEAVHLIKKKPLAYHAVLMDVSMPVMDGLEATAAIREMRNEVPIIAVTGNALKGDFETYLAKGMNDFVAKPIHRKELARILLQWVGP
ncbi:hypothetical protein D8B26_005081 [Coccidioides posadasii str. Silveira]|uniref:Sensor histidine kinase/response regulator Fos-1 n=1 Tax=Coccidioides posadasii (strain RMSCC 757 / Silveira) TaxID=443226 RepID=E9D5R1_COCPS|nr:sensor histidine kinase/response regulator Fos-1 [Coccidioides posadasii str. Silveira]QVM10421.1 hypothetical protein D8B26_005081 [Coccidioides posadasii str. Silveira]